MLFYSGIYKPKNASNVPDIIRFADYIGNCSIFIINITNIRKNYDEILSKSNRTLSDKIRSV